MSVALAFTGQDAISTRAFDNLQVSALKRPPAHLAVNITSHPTMRAGSHSFSVPAYILVLGLHTIIVDRSGCEYYLSPSSPRGESLVHCAKFLNRLCSPQYQLNLRPTAKRDMPPLVDHLTGTISLTQAFV